MAALRLVKKSVLTLLLWITKYDSGVKWNTMVRKWEEVECQKIGRYAFLPTSKRMLIGEFTHTLDDKNRLSLPAKFRRELGKKVIVTNGVDSCLFVFSTKEWEKFSSQISGLSLVQGDKRKFTRFMLGGATEAEVDSLGRILIPDFLKEFAKLKNKVVVTGVHSRTEIWSEKNWSAYKKGVEKDIDILAEKLGEVGALT